MYGLRSREESLRCKGEALRVMVYGGKEDVDGLFVKQIDRKRHLRDLLLWSRKRAARRRKNAPRFALFHFSWLRRGCFGWFRGFGSFCFMPKADFRSVADGWLPICFCSLGG